MFLTDLTSEQLLLLIVPALPNLWALRHAMYHEFPSRKEKTRWMMACVFLPCLGGIAYYAAGRRRATGPFDPFAARRPEDAVHEAKGENVPPKPEERSTDDKDASSAFLPRRSGPDEWSFGSPDGNGRKDAG